MIHSLLTFVSHRDQNGYFWKYCEYNNYVELNGFFFFVFRAVRALCGAHYHFIAVPFRETIVNVRLHLCVFESERERRSFQIQKIWDSSCATAYSFIIMIQRIPRANARFMVFAIGKSVFALDVRGRSSTAGKWKRASQYRSIVLNQQ